MARGIGQHIPNNQLGIGTDNSFGAQPTPIRVTGSPNDESPWSGQGPEDINNWSQENGQETAVRVVTNADGSTTVYYSDGNAKTTWADGTIETDHADGSYWVQNSNGTGHGADAQGDEIVANGDGSGTITTPQGISYHYDANGTVTRIADYANVSSSPYGQDDLNATDVSSGWSEPDFVPTYTGVEAQQAFDQAVLDEQAPSQDGGAGQGSVLTTAEASMLASAYNDQVPSAVYAAEDFAKKQGQATDAAWTNMPLPTGGASSPTRSGAQGGWEPADIRTGRSPGPLVGTDGSPLLPPRGSTPTISTPAWIITPSTSGNSQRLSSTQSSTPNPLAGSWLASTLPDAFGVSVDLSLWVFGAIGRYGPLNIEVFPKAMNLSDTIGIYHYSGGGLNVLPPAGILSVLSSGVEGGIVLNSATARNAALASNGAPSWIGPFVQADFSPGAIGYAFGAPTSVGPFGLQGVGAFASPDFGWVGYDASVGASFTGSGIIGVPGLSVGASEYAPGPLY